MGRQRQPVLDNRHLDDALCTGTGSNFCLFPSPERLPPYCVSTTWQVVSKLHSTTAGPARPSLEAAGLIRRTTMLYYALVFLLIAILAAVFGFGGVAIVSAGIAKILFFVFIVLFLVSLITHMSRRV